MWRVFALVLVGCNSLLGIHELTPDATSVDADPCTGVCECRIDTDCTAEYTVCLDQITSRTCVCAAGYTMGATGCAWTGVVVDPGLDDPTKWTVNSTASIDATGTGVGSGMIDPGEAVMQLDTTCAAIAQVSQQITMPRRSRAQPLVATINYEEQGTQAGELGWALNSIWENGDFPYTVTSWQGARHCLGAGQYASESTTGLGAPLQLLSAYVPVDCGPDGSVTSTLDVDHFDIVPANANECPSPGTALNGDAEGSGGWVFSKSASDDFAGFAADVGQDGTRGVRLFIASHCDTASATVPISVPLADATGSALLSIYHSTAASYVSIAIEDDPLALSGGTSPTVERYCIPALFRGGVFSLSAAVEFSSGECAAVLDEADIDNVTITNDPSCGNDPAIADPGFESGLSLIGPTVTTATVASVIDADAHGGQRDLQMSVDKTCGAAELDLPIMPPPSVGTAGPEFQFWYRFAQGSETAFAANTYDASGFTPIRDGEWHQGSVCLDPYGGGASFVEFVLANSSLGTCGTAFSAETVAIDDLSVTTDPSCPAH